MTNEVAVLSDEDLCKEINRKLSFYALALPINGVSHDEALEINKLLDQPQNSKLVINKISMIVMQPHNRSLWLSNRLLKIEDFVDLIPIVDFAYLAYCRCNIVGSYFSLIPVVEGIILRWMKRMKLRKKPSFKEIKTWITDKRKNPQFTEHPFAFLYIEVILKILSDEFFQDTRNAHTYNFFNRHVAAHLLKEFKIDEIKGMTMRLFVIIEILIEIYAIEANMRFPVLFKAEAGDKRYLVYKTACLGNLNISPELILAGLYK